MSQMAEDRMNEPRKDVLRETDDEAIRLAKSLVRSARHGAIATLDPRSRHPQVTRVGLSTDIDGTPTILVSGLSAHTPALRADGHCSLLIGEPGKGDPLAHPRITIRAEAEEIAPGTPDAERIGNRYLAHQPRARLYAGLGDFRYFRLNPGSASLNGGFGRAYSLSREDLLSLSEANDGLAAAEMSAMAHMNEDHADAVELYARAFAKGEAGDWRLVGIDADGVDVLLGDDLRRVFFPTPIGAATEMRQALVELAGAARARLASMPRA
jgi:putative heme iron utilization protein